MVLRLGYYSVVKKVPNGLLSIYLLLDILLGLFVI